VQSRRPALEDPTNAQRTLDVLAEIHASGDAEIAAATVMFDHVHLLFTLGTRLRVGQILGKFKTLVRDRGRAPWRWQEDGFERRLRPRDTIEDFGFYIFLNPYRAGLIPLDQRWPWWFCPDPKRFEFLGMLDGSEAVPAEWLPKSIQLKARW
jgi:putative transposase